MDKLQWWSLIFLCIVLACLVGAVWIDKSEQPPQIEQLQARVQDLQEQVDTLTEQSATKAEVGAILGISYDVSDRLAKVEGRQ